jgi:hypothetical protein
MKSLIKNKPKHHNDTNKKAEKPKKASQLSHNHSPLIQRALSCACGGGCPRCTETNTNQPVQDVESFDTPPSYRLSNTGTFKLATRSGIIDSQLRQTPLSEITNRAFKTPGRPLGEGVRTELESYFREDLKDVRIHHDPAAAESASTLGSEAFTAGRHIAFGADQYNPNSHRGKRLLIHEIAHTAQIKNTSSPRNMVAPPSNLLERDAVQAAASSPSRKNYQVRTTHQPMIHLSADPRLEEYLQRLRQLRQTVVGPVRSSAVLRDIVRTLRGLNLSEPDNLRPVIRTIAGTFSRDVLILFLRYSDHLIRRGQQPSAEDQARMDRTIRSMQVGRRGPYGQYGPGVILPVLSQPARRILYAGRSARAFFTGLLNSLRRSLSTSEIRQLSQKIAMSTVVNLALPIVITAGMLVGVYEDIRNAISGLYELVTNFSEMVSSMLEMVDLLTSRGGAQVAQELGEETGRNYAGQIRRVLGRNIFAFTYELGKLIGPMIVYTVLSIVTAGIVSGAAVSVRLASLLRRFPRAARLFGRIRRMLRRRRGRSRSHRRSRSERRSTRRERQRDADSSSGSARTRRLPASLSRCRVGSLYCPIDFLRHRPEFQAHFRERNSFLDYVGELPNRDLDLGPSPRSLQRVRIETGDAMYRQFLETVESRQWSEPFRDAMARIHRRSAREGIDYRRIMINGQEHRWPLQGNRPWTVHHEPPLEFIGGESSSLWRPIPLSVHDDVHGWWTQFRRMVLERVPRHLRREVVRGDIDLDIRHFE